MVAAKVAPRVPEVVRELRRGSMKEGWGLALLTRTLTTGRLEMAVQKGECIIVVYRV